ncbi:MAG: calcium-binding protein, partial [Planctomycetota bacterium]
MIRDEDGVTRIDLGRPTSLLDRSQTAIDGGSNFIRGNGTDDLIFRSVTTIEDADQQLTAEQQAILAQLTAPAEVTATEALGLMFTGVVTRPLLDLTFEDFGVPGNTTPVFLEASLYPLLFNEAFTGQPGLGVPAVTSATQALQGAAPWTDTFFPGTSNTNLQSANATFTGFFSSPTNVNPFTGATIPVDFSGADFGGPDRIFGRGGNDVIIDLEGNNLIMTEEGNDTIVVGFGDDRIVDDGGNNLIQAFGGRNSITTGDEDDTITTGDGDDNINAFDGRNVIDAGGGNNIVRGGNGFDEVTVGTGNDFVELRGGALSEDLNDNGILDIGEDRDFDGVLDEAVTETFAILNTGTGFVANNYVVDAGGNDVILANAATARTGDDIALSDVTVVQDDTGTFPGFRAVEVAPGVFGDDTIDLKGGDNYILDGGGNDTVRTLDGNDIIFTSFFAAGDDDINAGAGIDEIFSGGGADRIQGGPGADQIELLDDIGGPATDTLIYNFNDIVDTPGDPDQVGNFVVGEDLIDVSAFTVADNGFDLSFENYVNAPLSLTSAAVGWDIEVDGVIDFFTTVLAGVDAESQGRTTECGTR